MNMGQVSGPGVNFGSVYGLASVTVHMSFSLPCGNFERRLPWGGLPIVEHRVSALPR